MKASWVTGDAGFRRWLLVGRKVEAPEELAYYLVYGPAGTSLAKVARVAGRRWAIERAKAVVLGTEAITRFAPTKAFRGLQIERECPEDGLTR